MSLRASSSLLCSVLLLLTFGANAKVTVVYEGVNALSSAITAAKDGDTLILNGGIYYESAAVRVEKSLTIRSRKPDNKAIVSMQNGADFYIGTDYNNRAICEDERFTATIQGIKLVSTSGSSSTYLAIDFCVEEANIIESEFLNTAPILSYHGRYGDGKDRDEDYSYGGISNIAQKTPATVRLIGNFIQNHRLYLFMSTEVYIAGNTIIGGIYVDTATTAYVVGNSISCRGNSVSGYRRLGYHASLSNSCVGVQTKDVANHYIIANQVTMPLSETLDYDGGNYRYQHGIYTGTGGVNIIANNLIKYELNGEPAGDEVDWDGTANGLYGIYSETQAYNRIHNNLISYDASVPPIDEATIGSGIQTGANDHSEIHNNMVINAPKRPVYCAGEGVNLCSVSYNLCFGGAENCDADSNNINADPLIASDTYVLGAESPAIDAGIDKEYYLDLDTTHSDIGLHGGPFGFTQFSSQLEQTDNPFIYPLFHNIAPADAESVVVKVLAVARL